MASAMNAEYKDKQELFANALINGTVSGALETAEKFKFIDILRLLSKPALDVLAFMYGIREEIRGQNTERMAEIIINANGSEKQLRGMDFYLTYACIVEIKNTGLLSSATAVSKNVGDRRYRVTGSYSEGTESCTPFTQRFVEFVTDMH